MLLVADVFIDLQALPIAPLCLRELSPLLGNLPQLMKRVGLRVLVPEALKKS